MKKEYIVGGLALLGVIGVISYLRKPKKNSDGFFGANGRMTNTSKTATKRCAWCKSTEGDVYFVGNSGRVCDSGDRCITPYA